MNERVLIFAAHPDDEILGCGGTIAYHRSKGDAVGVCYLSEGVSSRFDRAKQREKSLWVNDMVRREDMAKSAAEILDFEIVEFLRLPNLRMEDEPLLDIVKQIIEVVKVYSPTIVYVNFQGDLNTDHRVTFDSVYTALRPSAVHQVKRLLCYETLSSTEWAPSISRPMFTPDTFIDISEYLDVKVAALAAYSEEMRPAPHSRSIEAVKALATYRGSQVGFLLSEAFVTVRNLLS